MGNCAGIDWASEKHDVLIEDPAGKELLATTFGHGEAGISALCAALECFEAQVVAIERPDGLCGKAVAALSPQGAWRGCSCSLAPHHREQQPAVPSPPARSD